jgi:hypothetical protein
VKTEDQGADAGQKLLEGYAAFNLSSYSHLNGHSTHCLRIQAFDDTKVSELASYVQWF